MKKLILTLFVSVLTLTSFAEQENLWLRYTAISPDGTQIAFTYKGDIFVAPVNGGTALQLTTNAAYETRPVWSNNSRTIAYMSDREGGFDIYTIPSQGGESRRITFNSARETPFAFTPDDKNILFGAYLQKPAKNSSYPTGGEVYMVGVNGGRPVQVMDNYGGEVSVSNNGKTLLYETKNQDNAFRKHHTSSASRDIYAYDTETKKHTLLFDYKGEDTDPVFNGDNSKIYFLSERNGSNNVFVAPADNPQAVTQVSFFTKHPVRSLSVAKDGTLCYSYDGEIYTQKEGQEPQKVKVTINADFSEALQHINETSGGYSASVSPDGKQVVFVFRGDIFVTSTDYGTTRRITETAAGEANPHFSPDGRTIVYSSERGNFNNIYKATIVRPEEVNFANATLIKEEALFPEDSSERSRPQISPDGKQLSYVLDRKQLWVSDLNGKNARQVTDGKTHPDFEDLMNYSWSPDGKWFAIEHCPYLHNPYCDVAIVNIATKEIINLTESAYFHSSPRWVMGGNAILHISDRYGMRSHASWGSEDDVMITFLNKKAFDDYKRSKEDIDLAKAAKKEEPKEEKNDKKGKKEQVLEPNNDIIVEREGLQDRTLRLTSHSSSISAAAIDKEGENLYYIGDYPDGRALWKVDLKEGSIKMLQKVQYATIDTDKELENLYLFGRDFYKFNLGSGDKDAIDYEVVMDIDKAKEREYMLKHVGIQEGKMFYNTSMHGVDWPALVTHYSRFLPSINNNYDFAEMLSELLGELNVSHTGSGYRSPDYPIPTASFGLLYDLDYQGDGLKVSEVIAGSPFDNSTSKLKAGAVITAINGKKVPAGESIDKMLEGIEGKKTLVSFNSGKNNIDEVIYPISKGRESDLMYKRWVRERERIVDSLSGGRLGYVHIDGMDDSEFRKAYSAVLGKYNLKDGIVVDIRFNRGGRLHEDIEILFSGEQYLMQTVRGIDYCTMPSRRSTKPSVMVVNQACYSNAHGTPWVYRYKKLGKIVGMPVAGTMTSVEWEDLQDETLYFGIPEIGYRTAEGTYLENSELEPDIKVENTPETLAEGKDLQLEAAVQSLLKTLGK